MAPNSLLLAFSEENQPQLLQAILQNPNCSEDVVLRFVNRGPERSQFYQALADTRLAPEPGRGRGRRP